MIKFGKLHKDAKIPTYATDGSGWADVYACFDDYEIVIPPYSTRLIPTGLCSEFDKKYRVRLSERGSNAVSGLIVQAGCIDSDYTGEWFVALYNIHDKPLEITKGVDCLDLTEDFIRIPYSKAICQMAVEEIPNVEIVEGNVDEIINRNSQRGDGCLGSTDR
jgi:dUTP pyrophosphatase